MSTLKMRQRYCLDNSIPLFSKQRSRSQFSFNSPAYVSHIVNKTTCHSDQRVALMSAPQLVDPSQIKPGVKLVIIQGMIKAIRTEMIFLSV